MDIGRSVGADGANVVVHDAQTIAEGETATFEVEAEDGDGLSIVLAYADAPAEMAAARQLVNDLDLCVVTPSGRRLAPNSLDAPDRLNNVEGVKIAAAEKGTYRIEVNARTIPSPMAASLTGGRGCATRYSVVAIRSSPAAEERADASPQQR